MTILNIMKDVYNDLERNNHKVLPLYQNLIKEDLGELELPTKILIKEDLGELELPTEIIKISEDKKY